MKGGLNVTLKYWTPVVVLRDSRLSPLFISATPTSRFFSACPRFVSSSALKSRQSSINSSLNFDVDPSKSGGFLFVTPLFAACCSVDSARYDRVHGWG